VRRIGSVREQRVNVRIVAATHRPLETLVRAGALGTTSSAAAPMPS
jgi:two-component system, NtrC family, response regulator AtoC